MKLSRLENQLRFFENKNQDTLLLEDALIILNTVYQSYNYDLHKPLPECPYENEELFAEGLTAQLYSILAICRMNENILLADEELSDTAGELENYYEKLRKLKTEKEELEKEKQQREAAKSEIEASQACVDKLKAENAELRKWLDENPKPDPATEQQQNKELSGTKEKYRKTLDNIASLEEQLRKLNEDWSAEIQKSMALDGQKRTLNEKITAEEEKIAELEQEIPQLTNREAELTGKMDALNDQVAEWNRLIGEKCAIRGNTLIQYRDQLDGLLKDAQKEIRDCGEEILRLQAELVEENAVLETKRTEKQGLDKQLKESNDTVDALTSEISEKRRFLAKEGEIQSKKQELEQEKAQIEPKYQNLKELMSDLEILEEENNRKNREIAEAEKNRQRFEDSSRSLSEIMTPEWKIENTKIKDRLHKFEEIIKLLKEDTVLLNENEPFDLSEEMWKKLGYCIQFTNELEEKIQSYLSSVNT